ncbi:MAG: hypothetical protein A2632_00910 [Candidatus Pacebacteria bacterium RIFCSPHIGHO2_01_FULL_46_16]|nr:MAG: hypothetical protein A2632_00910 [Candidatus Pacebacteria bacterium RIFCSPHIGHO2_01_FULL_46_16]
MRVSIIIVSYNTQAVTLRALQSVVDSFSPTSQLKHDSEVIVVDNHSSDGSYAAVKKLVATFFLPLTVLKNPKNTGFAHANNQAIARARGEVLMLLNSDTLVSPGTIDQLYKTLTQSSMQRLGILAATLRNLDGTEQPQGGAIPTLWTLANHLLLFDDLPFLGKYLPSTQHTGQRALPTPTKLRLQGWVAATAVCIKKAVFIEIGLLDENIFMYGEDVEFCLRAQKHHWQVGIEPRAVVVHVQAGSSNKQTAILGELKGYSFIWTKHMPLWQRPLVNAIIRLGVVLRWWLFATIGRSEEARLYRSLLSKV